MSNIMTIERFSILSYTKFYIELATVFSQVVKLC